MNADQPSAASPVKKQAAWKQAAKPVLGLVVLAGIIAWSVGIGKARVGGGRVNNPPGLPVAPGASFFTVKAESVAPLVDVVGTVSSERKVNLSARISGMVKEIFVSAGSAVTNGQPVLVLDDREIREQVTAADAQFKQAESEMNRTLRLFEKQASTEQAMTAARSLYDVAKAQLDRARVMQTYARIDSPLDGVVTDRRVEAGDLANPGQPLLAVYDPMNMQLEAPVPVRLLGKLPIGQSVEVALDRFEGQVQGRVREIVSEIDPLSRTQIVKVHLEGMGGRVLPGTFGRLWVADDAHPAFMIPASAVYSVGQIELVQVVRDGRAIRRAVRSGLRTGDRVEILSGLGEGDVVLRDPVKGN